MNCAEREARVKATELCDSVSTLTLATSGDDSPWAAAVFFAADKKFNLYFVSDHRTQHARDIAANGKIAATINPDCDNWNDVVGLQLRGSVSVVDGLERAKAFALYFKKFPQIAVLSASPKGDVEGTIADRLKAAHFYKITPEVIRVIDNDKGFGHRVEFAP